VDRINRHDFAARPAVVLAADPHASAAKFDKAMLAEMRRILMAMPEVAEMVGRMRADMDAFRGAL
jgi:hypothetical protein